MVVHPKPLYIEQETKMREIKNLFAGLARAFAVVAAAAMLGSTPANAADYVLEAGQSDTLSADASYDSMTVNGDLTVNGGAILTPSITMTGGSVTVTGTGTKLGSGHSSIDTPTTWQMYPDENGQYGKITCKDDRDSNVGPGAAKFYLKAENEAVQSDTGYIDFLTLDNGVVCFREAYNETALTGRVSVVGTDTSTIFSPGARRKDAVFVSGAWAVRIEDGASLLLDFNNQGGWLNREGTTVEISGNADVFVRGGYDTGHPVKLNSGAHFNHNGSLSFNRIRVDDDCIFQINDSDVIGPGVTNVALRLDMSEGYQSRIDIAFGVTATMRNVEITGANSYLAGSGTAKIDASAADCSFKAHIRASDLLVVEKVGANEMVVSATTNIPKLVVREGTVRFTEDCTIANLTVETGAALIADGCVVTLQGESVGASLGSANGGEFVKAGSSRTAIYDPGAITGALHVAAGSLVFSKYGFSQKHWRWTFTKVASGIGPLHLGRLWIFGTDGETVTPNDPSLSGSAAFYTTYKNPNTVLTTPGWVCFRHDPATNVVRAAGVGSTQGENRLQYCFRSDLAGDLQKHPLLGSPVIDPNNAASHLGVELYLKADAKPVTGYNIMAEDATGYPVSWKVEASDDGTTWTTIETRNDEVHKRPGAYYFFDGEKANNDTPPSPLTRGKPLEHFHFTGYRNDGLAPFDEPMALQVDAGAEIDLRAFTGGQPVNALTIDMALGGGTIHGGVIAAGGRLSLVNAAGAGDNLFAPLPLTLDGTADIANLASWSVAIDGVAKRYKIVVANGTFRLAARGMTIVIH